VGARGGGLPRDLLLTDETPSARPSGLRVILLLAGLALVVASAGLALRPPRLVRGHWYRDPSIPTNYRGYATRGASGFEDLRLRLSGNRFVLVYIPPDGSRNTGWPRLTGRRQPDPALDDGSEEIELGPP
jgi:hypothetical protein